MTTEGPLIVQSDKTLLLETGHPLADECRAAISAFAELERAPEHMHTYRITPLALWNAAATGVGTSEVISSLVTYSRFVVPESLTLDVAEIMGRYGRLVLEKNGDCLTLRATSIESQPIIEEALRQPAVLPLIEGRQGDLQLNVSLANRGTIKQAFIKMGWPIDDQAGFVEGDALAIELDYESEPWQMRPYQRDAITSFVSNGHGLVLLPCGAGKTIVGAAASAAFSEKTLILATTTVSARQWRRELLARTSLTESQVCEYSGDSKNIGPVTIATYQILISKRDGEYKHLELFNSQGWGLIIYDEVHLLPAPVFRMTAAIQSTRRLGLTGTLIREDGREDDVFSLIGPKRYDAPWRSMEEQGWIAPARCVEVRVTLTNDERMTYATSQRTQAYRIASTAPSKFAVVDRLLKVHPDEPTLVIGQYIDQLEELAQRLQAPLITGKTSTKERERLYEAFRNGSERVLVVSKVANFSIDLPDASVAIQVSGTFGSRQEEAQRLGRILRPKTDGAQAHFYTIVARDTNDADYAQNRQRFLAEQGYSYQIIDASDLT